MASIAVVVVVVLVEVVLVGVVLVDSAPSPSVSMNIIPKPPKTTNTKRLAAQSVGFLKYSADLHGSL